MLEILTRAGCFVAIIVLGYVLRRKEFFKEGDFQVLSKIVLKITLPAAIVSSVSGREISPSLLYISLISLGAGILYMILGYLQNRGKGREKQAFALLNTSGYNIGNFTLPFVQNFLGPVGVITTTLFDFGNAFVCVGGAYSIATVVKGNSGKISLKKMAAPLLKSIPFDCYVVMTVLSVVHISLPAAVVSFADIAGGANAFLAMLMIGVGFRLSGSREQLGEILRILITRYSVAVLLALGCYFLLPLPLEMRQALVILVFSPIGSAVPAYTAELGEDVGLASATNSVSILISIVCIVTLLAVML